MLFCILGNFTGQYTMANLRWESGVTDPVLYFYERKINLPRLIGRISLVCLLFFFPQDVNEVTNILSSSSLVRRILQLKTRKKTATLGKEID